MKTIMVSIENYPACLYQNSNITRVESEGNYGKTITKFYINDLWFLNLNNYHGFCPSGRLDYIKIDFDIAVLLHRAGIKIAPHPESKVSPTIEESRKFWEIRSKFQQAINN